MRDETFEFGFDAVGWDEGERGSSREPRADAAKEMLSALRAMIGRPVVASAQQESAASTVHRGVLEQVGCDELFGVEAIAMHFADSGSLEVQHRDLMRAQLDPSGTMLSVALGAGELRVLDCGDADVADRLEAAVADIGALETVKQPPRLALLGEAIGRHAVREDLEADVRLRLVALEGRVRSAALSAASAGLIAADRANTPG